MVRIVLLILAFSTATACGTGRPGDPIEVPDAGATVIADGDGGSTTPAAEICGNGIDDDGDTLIDEDCPCTVGEERPCYDGDPALAGIGVCVQGVQRCEVVGADDGELGVAEWSDCTGSGQPLPDEVCGNDLDDDCDGVVDQDCPAGLGNCDVQCSGAEHVTYNAEYGVWIKVVLCSSQRYDLLMGASQTGPFYKIGDTAGHGQDHCELVNPGFTIPNEDDINSGTCSTCYVEYAGSIVDIPELFETPVYYRAYFGEPFEFTPSADRGGIHTSCWYECGVSF